MIRIEIVIDEEKLSDLIALLRTADVRGYTFMRHGGGLGSRGERRPDARVVDAAAAELDCARVFIPAAGSSSSSTFGPVPSARAISSRRCSP